MEYPTKHEWYVRTKDGIFGPYSSTQLKQYGKEGRLLAGYQIRKGRNGNWVKIEAVQGLTTRDSGTHLAAPPPPPAAHASVSAVTQRSKIASRVRASRTSPMATLAIVGVPVLALSLVAFILFLSTLPEAVTADQEPKTADQEPKTADQEPHEIAVSPLSVRQIVEANERSVLLLRGAMSHGTGFIVQDQMLVTNSHVIASEVLDPVTGEFENLRAYSPAAEPGRRGPFRVTLEYEDRDWDLAVLRIVESVDFRPVQMAQNYQFQRGESVTIIGNPGLLGSATLETAVSTGVLSTIHPINGRKHYQLGAAVNPGNSGGPVFGENGHVVGVVVSKAKSVDEISFCIPVNEAIEAVDRAREDSLLVRQDLWKSHNAYVTRAIASQVVPAGTVATVSNPSLSFVLIASNGEDLVTASECIYSGNESGMQQLVTSGRVMIVSSGTRVQVIESDVFCHVKILEGDFAGRTGLVDIQCLK